MQGSEDRLSDAQHVARELARLDIGIAALTEARFAEQGSLTEDGAGYTILYCLGKKQDLVRPLWCQFHVKISMARKLQNLILTASCPQDSQSRTANLLLSSVCTPHSAG